MQAIYQRIFITAAAIAIATLAYVGIVDDLGRAYTEAGLKRALITYGVSRGLNGVISVAQGTEVAVEPVGIGVTFAPGEILDPINDLIERFSWIVLASSTSLGIQRVLLDITAHPWFTALVTGLLLASVWLLWWPHFLGPGIRRWAFRLTLTLVIVRFLTPMIALANDGIYRVFLEPQFNESKQELEQTAGVMRSLNEQSQLQNATPPVQGSWWDDAKRAYDSARSAVQIDARMAEFKEAAANVSEHAVNLIVVFVLETLLFPLLFLWLGLQLLKRSLGMARDD